MLEEALFFVLGGVLTWGYSRVDARRRAAVHAQTREQIAELKTIVEETLARMRDPDAPATGDEAVRAPQSVGEASATSPPTLTGLGLEATLLRLKAHLEEAQG